MAINFPDTPVDGQEAILSNNTWMYSTSKSAWLRVNRGVSVSSGVDVYATISELPISGVNAGQQAFVESSNALYISNGSGWYSISLVNTNPTITAVQDASANTTPFTLATDGTATVITITASDPEDIPLTYNYSVSSGSLNGSTVTQADNVFTITPHASNATTFDLTFTASDGINTATSGANSFTLSFITEMNDIDNSTLTRTTNLQAMSGRTIGGLSFSADGTKFIAGMKTSDNSNPMCWYYTLTTPWDLSTGTRQSTAFGVDSWTLQNVVGVNVNSGQWFTGWHMTSDGAYLFTTEAHSGNVRRWDFGTPYDPTTLSYSGYTTNLGSGAGRNTGVYLSPDGHNLFISNHYYDYVAHVYLSTAFRPDTSGSATIGYISDNVIQDVFLSDTGLKLFTVSETTNVIRQWNLSTAWDLHSTSSGTDQLGTGDYTHSVGSQQAVCLNTADGDEFFVGNGLAVKTYAT